MTSWLGDKIYYAACIFAAISTACGFVAAAGIFGQVSPTEALWFSVSLAILVYYIGCELRYALRGKK